MDLIKDSWQIKTLDEITEEIGSGHQVTKAQLGTGDHPAVKCGDINSALPQQFTECVSFVDKDLVANKKYFENGDLLISHFGDQEKAGSSCVYLGNEKCLAGKSVYVIKHNQNPKFLNYCWSSKFIRNQINEVLYKGIVFYLFLRNLKEIKIPLPSLEEQGKVVKMLDKFYAATNDMNVGIPGLIQDIQGKYEYYRDEIFRVA